MHRSPKEAGEYIEERTLERFEMIEPVNATDWYDAIVVVNRPSAVVLDAVDVPAYVNEILELGVGDVLEVKAAQQRLASGARGRYYIRRQQHAKLLDADAIYVFVVYNPREGEVIALAFVRASDVDDVLPDGWTDVEGDRHENGYRQLTWTHFIRPDIVADADGAMDV